MKIGGRIIEKWGVRASERNIEMANRLRDAPVYAIAEALNEAEELGESRGRALEAAERLVTNDYQEGLERAAQLCDDEVKQVKMGEMSYRGLTLGLVAARIRQLATKEL